MRSERFRRLSKGGFYVSTIKWVLAGSPRGAPRRFRDVRLRGGAYALLGRVSENDVSSPTEATAQSPELVSRGIARRLESGRSSQREFQHFLPSLPEAPGLSGQRRPSGHVEAI